MARITNDLNLCVRVSYARAGFLGAAWQAFPTSTEQNIRWSGTSGAWASGCYYTGYEFTIEHRTRVAIDPNVRVRGNGTYAGFEDVSGPIAVGDQVEVYEAESGLVGLGRVTEIDGEKELVYLSVDWSSLSDEAVPPIQHTETSPGRALFVSASTAAPESEPEWMRLAARPSLACIIASDVGMTVVTSAFGWSTGFSNTWPFSANLSAPGGVVNDLMAVTA